jgi:hypothetical protein
VSQPFDPAGARVQWASPFMIRVRRHAAPPR